MTSAFILRLILDDKGSSLMPDNAFVIALSESVNNCHRSLCTCCYFNCFNEYVNVNLAKSDNLYFDHIKYLNRRHMVCHILMRHTT